MRKELVTRNVATLVADDLPKAVKPEPSALTKQQLCKLLSAVNEPSQWARDRGVISSQPWFPAAVWFAAYTGARRGEVLALRWTDLDIENGTVTIRRSLSETSDGLHFKTPKNGKSRVITIEKTLANILRRHKERQKLEQRALADGYRSDDLVFAMPDGRAVLPWTFSVSFRHLIKRAGVPYISLHGLRDTHASLLSKAGVPIEVISKRLGHSDISITASRYLYVFRERDAEAARAFDKLVAA